MDWPWVYEELKRWRKLLEEFMHIPGVDEHVEKLTALINFILDMRWPEKPIGSIEWRAIRRDGTKAK